MGNAIIMPLTFGSLRYPLGAKWACNLNTYNTKHVKQPMVNKPKSEPHNTWTKSEYISDLIRLSAIMQKMPDCKMNMRSRTMQKTHEGEFTWFGDKKNYRSTLLPPAKAYFGCISPQ